MSTPTAKKQRTQPSYTLLYHGGIPGRGEFIRLVFEATGTPYTDAANEGNAKEVYATCAQSSNGIDNNPPCFSPPMLKVAGAGKNGGTLILSQTSNILLYLGKELGLAGSDEVDQWHVNAITLTALDVNNEVHDTHHPISNSGYYEDQKDEAMRKATDFRNNRIPKYFSYFERVLKGNEEQGQGKYLVGSKLTFADTTLWHLLDGLKFAFPKEMAAREKEYPLLLDSFYPSFKEEAGIKEYMATERRLSFSNGIFRHYPELDRQ